MATRAILKGRVELVDHGYGRVGIGPTISETSAIQRMVAHLRRRLGGIRIAHRPHPRPVVATELVRRYEVLCDRDLGGRS